MFGGLTKTSSRVAITAAFGLALGGYAMSTSPANAADLGGDCCADLEERVAELEATTVRKGNKKVSVTISGWVVKNINFWDDGSMASTFAGGDKGYDLGSRFAITGSATISPGWSAGYNLTINTTGDLFATAGTLAASSQLAESGGSFFNLGLNPLYSYMYIKSDKWGAINWGHLSPASDNPAVLADVSGTVIETNGVWFEGASFFLRPTGGASGLAGLSTLTWGSFVTCAGLGLGIGVDCFGAAMPAVRYDSPTWGGFRFETSYGTNTLTAPVPTTSDKFWDIAAFYNKDWGNFKVSAAYAYTMQQSSALATTGFSDNTLNQVGASLMHMPSGLGLYGMYETGEADFIPTTSAWYFKPFIKKTWSPLGSTVLYGEYGQYEDMYGGIFGIDQCAAGAFPVGTSAAGFCAAGLGNTLFVTDSEIQRWGLGVVQEIDSAAMHLYARWQHQDADIDFTGVTAAGASGKVSQGFDDWDLFQIGGVIFF